MANECMLGFSGVFSLVVSAGVLNVIVSFLTAVL